MIQGCIYRDSVQPLLHRLPPGAGQTPCGVWDVGLSNQLFEDSVPFAQTLKCQACFTGQVFTDVHTGHCCSVHGCKYSKDGCTVVLGLANQEHPCEYCSWEAEEMESRGETYEYAVTDGLGTYARTDERGSGQQAVLAGSWKLVRRRVSQWEEVN